MRLECQFCKEENSNCSIYCSKEQKFHSIKKIFYICNRKQCKNCYSECSHTSNLNFAKNYNSAPRVEDLKNFYQVENDLFESEEVNE